MLTISLKSSELPGGGAAKMIFTSCRMKLSADIIMQAQNTQYLEYTMLDLVYIPAVITLMSSAS